MRKNVNGFEMERGARTSWGDVWSGAGWVAGRLYYADGVFLYYSKREIARLLKNKILKKANA